MNSEKNGNNNSPKKNIEEEDSNSKIENDKVIKELKEDNIIIKKDENLLSLSNNNKASIEMQKETKNKKRKKIKIRAYCNKCYQFFENGPYSKICRNHLQKNCNLIECQKYNKNGDNLCIRKFTNINSANRHTHCLTKKDIELWDSKCEIQKCLGKKKEPDNKYLDLFDNNNNNNIPNNNKIIFNDNNSMNNNKIIFNDNNSMSNNKIIFNDNNSLHNNSSLNMNINNLFLDNTNNNSFFDNNSQNYFNNNFSPNNSNVMGLIEDIDKLHFSDNDNKNDANNIKGDNEEIKNIFKKQSWDNKEESEKNEKIKKNEDDDKTPPPPECSDNLSIEDFFEKVQKETNIPNNIKKKLVNAFKKKGILNVKILILFYEKYKNWDFLIQKFKKVTPQIEGVALCIEFLLNLH
jgi:hypothetical protein